MSANRSTISFSPPFGYALCARRVRPSDLDRFDLSSWRVAGVGAEMSVIVGQVHRLAHQPHGRAVEPGLADARVQDRGLGAGIGADQKDVARRVDILDPRGADIGAAIAGGQVRAVGAAFDPAAQTLDHPLQAERRLDRRHFHRRLLDSFVGLGRCRTRRAAGCGELRNSFVNTGATATWLRSWVPGSMPPSGSPTAGS